MSAKVAASTAAAVADIAVGATPAVGGFGLCGIPDALIAAIAAGPAAGFEVYSDTAGSTTTASASCSPPSGSPGSRRPV
jgi:3-oxoacid CoA-transferase subunit A